MIEEYEKLIWSVLKKVPSHLKDDCYQAACVGLLKAFRKKKNAKNFNSYAWSCMRNEVLNIVANLNYPISLDKITFLKLCKYKNAIRDGEPIDSKLSNKRKAAFNMLTNLKRVEF